MKVGTQNIVLSKGIIFTALAFAKLGESEFKFLVCNQGRRKEWGGKASLGLLEEKILWYQE